MENLSKIIRKVFARGTHFIFWNCIKIRSLINRYLNGRQMKILVSDFNGLAWRENLESGFRRSNLQVDFASFSDERIKNYDCLVPITIKDLVYLDDKRELFQNNPFPVPSKESVLLCDDKYLFSKELIRKGFGRYIPTIGVKNIYPYILKKKVDVSGQSCQIVLDRDMERNYSGLLEDKEYFTQELVLGHEEYATHILFKENQVVTSLNIKYVFDREFPIKGQIRHEYTRIATCPHLELFSSILKAINFEGLCCFNYKEIEDRPMIIEINPRCGYSLSPYLFHFVERVL